MWVCHHLVAVAPRLRLQLAKWLAALAVLAVSRAMRMSSFVLAVLCLSVFAGCDSDDTDEQKGTSRNKACAVTTDCREGLTCVEGLCRESCGASYFSATACLGNEYCAPFANEATGFCAASDCDISSDCDDGQVCSHLKSLASTCATPCSVSFDDGSYSDDCPANSFCQAIGQGPQRRLVCMPATVAGQPVGTFCNPVDNPCATSQSYLDQDGNMISFGLTCLFSECVELCAAGSANPGADANDCGASVARGATYCCTQTGADGTSWGLCMPFTSDVQCNPQLN